MDIFLSPGNPLHETGNHPENQGRLRDFTNTVVRDVAANESLLRLIHTDDYIEKIRSSLHGGFLLDTDTSVSQTSWQAALLAVSATVSASETQGFALVRPPGHHAFPSNGAGFCIFNNIAIAVKKIISDGKKVLVVDFDGHLGDGTEAIFYESNRVLYWSMHQFPAYPGKGLEAEIGAGEGTGYTINIPLPPNSGDDIATSAIATLPPLIGAFRPDVIAVSAGFDGHHADPLLELHLTQHTYHAIGHILRESSRPVFATLEGGYNPDTLPKCIGAFVCGLNGADFRFTEETSESMFLELETFDATLNRLRDCVRTYWSL